MALLVFSIFSIPANLKTTLCNWHVEFMGSPNKDRRIPWSSCSETGSYVRDPRNKLWCDRIILRWVCKPSTEETEQVSGTRFHCQRFVRSSRKCCHNRQNLLLRPEEGRRLGNKIRCKYGRVILTSEKEKKHPDYPSDFHARGIWSEIRELLNHWLAQNRIFASNAFLKHKAYYYLGRFYQKQESFSADRLFTSSEQPETLSS